MDLTPEEKHLHYNRLGFPAVEKEQQAINYLIDSEVEEERKMRWEKLLPRIRDLQNGGKEEERELIQAVRQGIDDSLRYKIWPMLIDNPMKKFADCVNKCEIKDINLDLDRTFPTHKLGKTLESRLKVVLNALAFAIPEVGYCQGMNFIVGTILLRLDDEQAFNMSYHIFHWQKHQQLLTSLNLIHEKLYALDRLIQRHYPQLFKHLKLYEVDAIVYATSWFITIFCNCLPTSYVFRILQCFLLEGEKVIYRVALQILKMKKHSLKQMNKVEKIVEELKNYDELLDSNIDAFFDSMFKINLSRADISEYKGRFRQKQKQVEN